MGTRNEHVPCDVCWRTDSGWQTRWNWVWQLDCQFQKVIVGFHFQERFLHFLKKLVVNNPRQLAGARQLKALHFFILLKSGLIWGDNMSNVSSSSPNMSGSKKVTKITNLHLKSVVKILPTLNCFVSATGSVQQKKNPMLSHFKQAEWSNGEQIQ